MIESVEAYLAKLKEELVGCDPAITQDALADAEEHLRNALEQVPGAEKEVSEDEALIPIIEKYGSPEEIAAAYREIATLTQPALAEQQTTVEKPFINRFFSIISDAKAWGALLYLILSMITGIVYFTWAITGLSLSLSLMVLIIGLPFTVLFLLSVRSIALVEGRIVEALLGVRMPRRPFFTNRQAGWWEQVKSLFLEIRTWTAMAYMVLQLPLGVIYFTVFITLIALSLGFILNPILVLFLDVPLIHFGGKAYYSPPELIPFVVSAGLIVLLATMHLAKYVGRLHGAIAKTLLVGGRSGYENSGRHIRNRDSHIMEDPMERNEKAKPEIEERPPLLAIILSIAIFVVVIGITLYAFLMSS
ncbi:MAG: sensor domain-containing protein [Anaerolineales bacterium]|nr:sensor domain-containing protein [Anaerolineales bacterium]